MVPLSHWGLIMIRNVAIFTTSLLFVAGCAANNGFKTTQNYAPANFKVADVYVNMTDGVDNSKRIRKLMKNAGLNTAKVYNSTMRSVKAEYPLEIEVTDINYRDPKSTAVSGDRTYIRYTATLREESSGAVYRSLPVTYYYVATGALNTNEAKQMAEKNMIRISIKNAFAKLYGMESIPRSVQTHFNTADIFANPNAVQKPAVKPAQKAPQQIALAPTPQPVAATPAPEVIVAPDEAIIEPTSTDGGPTVLKCAVC